MKSNEEAQSEAPSVDSILDSYANFKVWESKQDWEDGYDREGNIANSRNIAAAKINRLIAGAEENGILKGLYQARYATEPGSEEEQRIDNQIAELSNNLSKGKDNE